MWSVQPHIDQHDYSQSDPIPPPINSTSMDTTPSPIEHTFSQQTQHEKDNSTLQPDTGSPSGNIIPSLQRPHRVRHVSTKLSGFDYKLLPSLEPS